MNSAPSVANSFFVYTRTMHNPVIQDVLALIRDSLAGLSEFSLHRALAEHETFVALGNDGQLSLFRKHFLVMNALYQLQPQLWNESRQVLSISPLHIQLYNCADESESAGLADHGSSADYYLNWDNYRHTAAADVENLLDSFWRKYYRYDGREEAMKQLELEANASPAEIESRYRQLVSRHHPDRGGDQEAFIRIRAAYELLR